MCLQYRFIIITIINKSDVITKKMVHYTHERVYLVLVVIIGHNDGIMHGVQHSQFIHIGVAA